MYTIVCGELASFSGLLTLMIIRGLVLGFRSNIWHGSKETQKRGWFFARKTGGDLWDRKNLYFNVRASGKTTIFGNDL